jgi:hypothetical protein
VFHPTSGPSTLYTEIELLHVLFEEPSLYLISKAMAVPNVDPVENLERMKAGEMYYAFTPDLMADRRRCKHALTRYNKAQDISRREELEMLNEYVSSTYLYLFLT